MQPFLELGALGGICVHTHVVGPQVAEQVRAALAGDVARAREIDRELRPAYELLQAAPNPIAIKAALNLLGHEVGGHRLPLVPPTGDELARSAAASSGSACSSARSRRPTLLGRWTSCASSRSAASVRSART